jgi:tetratricopeptide (TPR) repeat protein
VLTILAVTGISLHAASQANQSKDILTKTRELSKKIKTAVPDTVADAYYNLGETLYQNGDYQKSESNLIKARDLFKTQKNNEGFAKSTRLLGMVQEKLNKNEEALSSYKSSEVSFNATGNNAKEALVKNDIVRLSAGDSLRGGTVAIDKNVETAEKIKDTLELVKALETKGSFAIQKQDWATASRTFSTAVDLSSNNVSNSFKYQELRTEVLANNNQTRQAIVAQKEWLARPEIKSAKGFVSLGLINLGKLYTQTNQDDSAEISLKQAYETARQASLVMESRKSIEALDSFYLQRKQLGKSIELFRDFNKHLPDLLMNDSSFRDSRLLKETEQRVSDLEKEKKLQFQLSEERKQLNFWLVVALVVLLTGSVFLAIIYRQLKIQKTKVQLQSLRREMNPHFIFNSLNAVNRYISTHNEIESNKYLSRFAGLMRSNMEASTHDFISIETELSIIRNYLDLEKQRFPEGFEWNLNENFQYGSSDKIPGMLIQPFVENAIWHGLRHSTRKGFLQIDFSRENGFLMVKIRDSGIGLEKSKALKSERVDLHKGRGIKNTEERIMLLNRLYGRKIQLEIRDGKGEGFGVEVELKLPIMKL